MSSYPTNLTNSQWQFIEKRIDEKRKRRYNLRLIRDAFLYLVKTGCQWSMLRFDFPH
ncbi:MAG: transposase [Prevotellaceae bacterium]|nr:transposase [Prevotellaceae bacterium]